MTRWVRPHSGRLASEAGPQSCECATQGLRDGSHVGMLATDLSGSRVGPSGPTGTRNLVKGPGSYSEDGHSLHQADEGDTRN